MSSWWAPSGATRARARSSTGCRNAPISSHGSRAAITRAIRIVIDGKVYKLSLLPSGIVRGGKLSVVGNGVVLDPWHLVKEIADLRDKGVDITPDNLMIAENAVLILPVHGELDRAREGQTTVAKIGTTGRGIGPAYEDKVGRRAIRVADLADDATLELRVDRLMVHHDALRRGSGGGTYRPRRPSGRSARNRAAGAALCQTGLEGAERRAPRGQAHPVRRRAGRAAGHRLRHLSLRDLVQRHRGQAATGTGLGPGAVNFVLGIVKAYTTRVGEGPFPAELHDDDGQRLGERGHEFGTVTGRKRRCGWFDAVLVRQTCATSGVSGIALTKLDVLDGFKTLKICVGYIWTANGWTTCRPPPTFRPASPRSMKRSRAGPKTPPARAVGPTCRVRPSNMSAGSRS